MIKHRPTHLLLAALAQLVALGAAPAQSPPPYAVSGQVYDTSGNPIRAVRVCAYPEELAPGKIFPCVMTGAGGRYLLRLNGAGRYRLITDKLQDGYWPQHLPFFRDPEGGVPEVTIGDGHPQQQVRITLAPKNGVLAGRGVDATTGLPLDDVLISLCHAANPQICFSTHAKGGTGQFRVPAPHVPFTLELTADGFEPWYGPDGGGPGAAMRVASGATLELNVQLTRQADAAARALSEAEKQAGVHLPAPVQLAPADGVIFDRYPRRTRLEWAPVAGAASYGVEVDFCQGGRGRRGRMRQPAAAGRAGQRPDERPRPDGLRVHVRRGAARSVARLGGGWGGARGV